MKICDLQTCVNSTAQFILYPPTSLSVFQFDNSGSSWDLSLVLKSNQLARVLSFCLPLPNPLLPTHYHSLRLAIGTHGLWISPGIMFLFWLMGLWQLSFSIFWALPVEPVSSCAILTSDLNTWTTPQDQLAYRLFSYLCPVSSVPSFFHFPNCSHEAL